MELTLAHQTKTKISVTCDGQHSHTFDLRMLIPSQEKDLSQPIDDPVAYGKTIYLTLFPPETLARHALDAMPERILLITTDNDLDTVPWEYVYGPDGFLVLECHFVRGLPWEQRIDPPLLDSGLHIIAVPSNPLDKSVPALNIDGEWTRLKEIIQHIPYAITLERSRPPTIEQVRRLVANQHHRVMHFMGHGGQDERGAVLYFEQDNGDLDKVTARQFMLRVRGTVFLVTLNACVSAASGSTAFSNLAAALVRQKVPYALGMRLSIPDEDARAFSRTFYSELAQGITVEEALRQARLTLADSPRPWAIAVPVLYTALAQPAAGFICVAGSPTIKEQQPRIEVSALPRAEGTFQGRGDELKQLGTVLTGDSRPRIITIHGGGGQGKTALTREAVERFAYAWPGGSWATSLENLPSREVFVNELARFLGIDAQKVPDPDEVERLVLTQLALHHTLIVLDNAETLIEAVEAKDKAAITLAELLQQLPGPSVSLLVTSRVPLGWVGEVSHELGGLTAQEGAELFRQSAPQRQQEIEITAAWDLSEKLGGHPLGLRLLGGAFNASTILLHDFIKEYEEQLLRAENIYRGLEHRHRSLSACIEISVRYLDTDLCSLLCGLWIFHAPFLPEIAIAIFDPEIEETEEVSSPVRDHLHVLWQRGLLSCETVMVQDETLFFYRLLPTTRPYMKQQMEQIYEREKLLAQFVVAYASLARFLYEGLNKSPRAVIIAQKGREDFERARALISGEEQAYYLLHWGWVSDRLGNPLYGLKLLEQALELAQGQDQSLELQLLNNIASVYRATGRPQEALYLHEHALPIRRAMGDRDGEAATLTGIAAIYQSKGKPQEALDLYEQALSIKREMGDREGEAIILNNTALVYVDIGQPQEALRLHEQALPIRREMGDRAGEATTLNNIAAVYRAMGQPKEALRLLMQALPIRREMGDRAGEAATLRDMATGYQAISESQEALRLYEQALFIHRELGDQAGEANTLASMALVYGSTGQPQKALNLYEQALSLAREVEDRAKEATVLGNIALVYSNTGRLAEALRLYEQALSIHREVRSRAGEVVVLNNIAAVHYAAGQPEKALHMYEQILPLMREIGNLVGEATILSNMALMYRSAGQLKEALHMYEQVLPLIREAGNRAGEAIILNNMGLIYSDIGQPQEALRLYERALIIAREVRDRASEATTLINMALAHRNSEQLQDALRLYEQALPMHREVGDRAGEAATLVGIAMLLYKYLKRCKDAIPYMEQAVAVLINNNLPQDASGQKVEELQHQLQAIRTDATDGDIS